MKILKIKIDGYKNILNTAIEFNGLNALIALNNYGKSNYFEAIEFANDFIQSSNKVKSKLMQSQNNVPINKITAGKNFSFEIEYETKINKIENIVSYTFSFEWIKQKNKGKRVIKEELKIKEKNDTKLTTFVNRTLTNKLYKSSKTGRCDKEIKINSNALIINKLNNFDDLYYFQIIQEINNFDFDFITLNNINKYFTPSFNTIMNDTEILEVSEVPNIAKFFYKFSKEKKKQYELLKNSIKDLLPDIEYIKPIQLNLRAKTSISDDIPFEVPEQIYDIRVKIKSNNQDTSINSLSEGSKRIFHIIATAIIADFSGTQLLAYEELENSIHPALLQRLLLIISELTKNTQIIITSHSPHLVKYLDLNDVYIGIPNTKGLAYFKKIKKSKQNKLIRYAKDTESTLGDFIFDMLVEGFDDDSFWKEFI